MYFKQDENLAHSSLNGISYATVKVYFILWAVEWMKCMYMSILTDKFVMGMILFTQMIMSFLVDKKYQCLSLTGSSF